MKGLVFCPIDCKRNGVQFASEKGMSTVYTLVHVKSAVCGCGHAFEAQCTTNESVKRA